MDPLLEAKRDRLIVARATHRAALADLARLESGPRCRSSRIETARTRVDQARAELVAARRALIRSI